MSEADNRKRNEHVQQQRPSVRKLIYSEFEQQGLTKRNLEYMVKLKEELARTKLPTAKQDDTIQQTLAEIKTAQKKLVRLLRGCTAQLLTKLKIRFILPSSHRGH